MATGDGRCAEASYISSRCSTTYKQISLQKPTSTTRPWSLDASCSFPGLSSNFLASALLFTWFRRRLQTRAKPCPSAGVRIVDGVIQRPSKAAPSDTSNVPQHDVGMYLGLYSNSAAAMLLTSRCLVGNEGVDPCSSFCLVPIILHVHQPVEWHISLRAHIMLPLRPKNIYPFYQGSYYVTITPIFPSGCSTA